jgi:hypothetical protein
MASNGGKREGAGRKKGSVGKLHDAARAQAAAQGITPLAYLLSLLRDEKQPQEIRTDAAKAAAPYLHAKLANIDANLNLSGEITVRASKEQRDAAVRAALAAKG